jgi:hypothetical protein
VVPHQSLSGARARYSSSIDARGDGSRSPKRSASTVSKVKIGPIPTPRTVAGITLSAAPPRTESERPGWIQAAGSVA